MVELHDCPYYYSAATLQHPDVLFVCQPLVGYTCIHGVYMICVYSVYKYTYIYNVLLIYVCGVGCRVSSW